MLPSLHPASFGKSACFSQEEGLRIMRNVAVNPYPRCIEANTVAASFFQRGALWPWPLFAGSFHVTQRAAPRAWVSFQPWEIRLLEVFSPDSFMEGKECNLRWVSLLCTFSESEWKIIILIPVPESVVGVYAVFSWHTMTFIKLPYIDLLCNSIKSLFPKLAWVYELPGTTQKKTKPDFYASHRSR